MRTLVSGLVFVVMAAAGCQAEPSGEAQATQSSSAAPTPSEGTRPGTGTVNLKVSPAPVAQSATGEAGLTTFHGRVRPAHEGADVVLERRAPGRSWSEVARTQQRADGTYVGGYAAKPREVLRVRTTPGGSEGPVSSGVLKRSEWPLVFEDDFAGSALDPAKWQVRHQPMQGGRMCSQPHDDRVEVTKGVAILSVRQFDSTKSETCPFGKFHNGMIGTTPTHRFTRGIAAARVKFQSDQGMHGAFWLQGPARTGAEIDVAEYFGDSRPGRVSPGLTVLIHHTERAGQVETFGKRGGELPTRQILGSGQNPANGFHVYSVRWEGNRYEFFLDGQLLLKTTRPHSVTAPEEIVLSLLTSDWELKHLRGSSSVMQVDWVRVWQAK